MLGESERVEASQRALHLYPGRYLLVEETITRGEDKQDTITEREVRKVDPIFHMQLRHLNTIIQPATGEGGDGAKMSKVMAVAWAPNNRKLAVCTVSDIVG